MLVPLALPNLQVKIVVGQLIGIQFQVIEFDKLFIIIETTINAIFFFSQGPQAIIGIVPTIWLPPNAFEIWRASGEAALFASFSVVADQ